MLRIDTAVGILSFALLALVLGACRAPAVKSISLPFTLSLSSGGGFAGSYEGFTLASTGEVTAWRQHSAGPRNVIWVQKTHPESIAVFARGLEPYRGTMLEQTGNVALSLGLITNQDEFRWTLPGAGVSPDSPEPFHTWYGRIQAFCRSLKPGT